MIAQKAKNAATDEAPSFLNAIFETAHEAICITDAGSHVLYSNARMAKLFAVHPASAIGKKLQLALAADTPFAQSIELAMRSDKIVRGHVPLSDCGRCAYEVAVHGKNSNRPFAIVTIQLQSSPESSPFVIRSLRETNNISDLILSVSQELAFPLNRVFRHVDRLLQMLDARREQQMELELNGIVRQLYRISSLAHNLVALSKHAVPNFVAVSANDVLLDAIEQCERERTSAIALNLYLHDRLPTIYADPLLLALVFQNLVLLADEMAGEDGVPRIRTEYCAERQQVRISVETCGPAVNVNGFDDLFVLFQGESQLSPGSLLGLFISKKLLQVQQAGLALSKRAESGNILEVTFSINE